MGIEIIRAIWIKMDSTCSSIFPEKFFQKLAGDIHEKFGGDVYVAITFGSKSIYINIPKKDRENEKYQTIPVVLKGIFKSFSYAFEEERSGSIITYTIRPHE